MRKIEHKQFFVTSRSEILTCVQGEEDDGWELCVVLERAGAPDYYDIFMKRVVPGSEYPQRLKNHQRPTLLSFVPGMGGETVVH